MKSVKIIVDRTELRAAVDVVKLLAGAAVFSLALIFILKNVPMSTIGWVLGLGLFGFMVYLMYTIRVAQLRYESKLKETLDTVKS